MSAASAKVSSKFSVRLDPETIAVVDDEAARRRRRSAAFVSSSSAICCVVRDVVPFAHHRRGHDREARRVGGIEVAAGAGNLDLKRDLRQAPILEHHHVQAVREIGFRRPRQFDLQHVVRDRRASFEDDRLRLRRRCAAMPSRPGALVSRTRPPREGGNDMPCGSLTASLRARNSGRRLRHGRHDRARFGGDEVLLRHALHVGGGDLRDAVRIAC